MQQNVTKIDNQNLQLKSQAFGGLYGFLVSVFIAFTAFIIARALKSSNLKNRDEIHLFEVTFESKLPLWMTFFKIWGPTVPKFD